MNPQLEQLLERIREDPELAKQVIRQAEKIGVAHAALARSDINAFITYCFRNDITGQPLIQTAFHRRMQSAIDSASRVVIHGHVEAGKALSLDTIVPSPDGETTMADIKVGDRVFGADGQPCTVTFATPVMRHHDCYRVTFRDGASVVADAEHLWTAHDYRETLRRANRKRKGLKHRIGPLPPRVVTTREMADELKASGQWRWSVPVMSAPADYPERELPLDPYALGVWLGDGSSCHAAVTYHVDDSSVVERVAGLLALDGIDLRVSTPKPTISPNVRKASFRNGLRTKLRLMGLIGNKHIPKGYLESSVSQRLELLRGLLDTDGSCDPRRSRVEITQVSRGLAEQIHELAWSLGYRASMKPKVVNGKTYYRVSWLARGTKLFHLKRKADRQLPDTGDPRARKRTIVSIEPIESVAVRCIQVDSADNNFMVTRDWICTHNTVQLSTARPIFELGRNPDLRIVMVQSTGDQAMKICRAIGRHITDNPRVHEVFPHLKPGDGPWNAHQLTVQRDTQANDPSLQAVGITADILGARIDLLFLDDILTDKNTRTEYRRRQILDRIEQVYLGRMTEDSRIVLIGNAWSPTDAMHILARRDGWKHYSFPVRDPVTGEPFWWSEQRIRDKEKMLGPIESARQLYCQPRSSDASRFKDEWFDLCIKPGLFGDHQMCQSIDQLPPGHKTITGVDVAVKKSLGADFSAVFTIMLLPNGNIRVLNVEIGQWDSPQLVGKIIDHHHRFRSTVYVETNGQQGLLLPFVKERAPEIDLKPFFTTASKKFSPEHGIESAAIEMSQGGWEIPAGPDGSMHPNIEAWVQDLKFYDPGNHPSDVVMAGWIAHQGARIRSRFRHDVFGSEPVIDVTANESVAEMQGRLLWEGLGMELEADFELVPELDLDDPHLAETYEISRI